MINKLKYLFLLILCVGLMTGATTAFAQLNEKILVSAKGKTLKQSDINNLIKFYE